MRNGKTLVLAVAAVALCAGLLSAQTPRDDAESEAVSNDTSERPAVGSVEPAKIDFWVRDKDGTPVRYLDVLTAEELKELIDRRDAERAPDKPTRYTISELVVSGQVEGNVARLIANVTIHLRADGWTQIPLRFGSVLLQQKPEIKGEGKRIVGFDEKGSQLVCWIDGKSESSYDLRMDFLVPVTREGDVSRIAFSAPPATVSRMTLEVPRAGIVPIDEDFVQATSKKAATVLSAPIRGELAWRDPVESSAAAPVVLIASTHTLFRVFGENRISGETRLKVESRSGPFSRFTLKLPAGVEIVSAQPLRPDNASTSVSEAADGAKSGKPREKIVDVRFEPTSDPVEIQLFTEVKSAGKSSGQELGGLVVEDAWIHKGTIDVAIEGEWSVAFKATDIEPASVSEEDRAAGVSAQYKYNIQPYSLKAFVDRRTTRVTIDPVYIVRVESDKLLLEARLNCIVDGTSAEQIKIDMSTWSVDFGDIESMPADIIQPSEASTTAASPMVIKLSPQAAGAGRFDIRLTARQAIPAGAESISFTLPRPQADMVTPAFVVVAPAANVQVLPQVDELKSLAADLQPPQLEGLPENRPSLLFFRDRGADEAATFVGRFEVRPRAVTVDVASRLQADEQHLHVKQTLHYQILHEPLDAILLSVPRSIPESGAGRLTVNLDGNTLSWGDAADEFSEVHVSDAERKVIRVGLPAARMGDCDIALEYRLPLPAMTARVPTSLPLPLVMPATDSETNVVSNRLNVAGGEAVQVVAEGDDWALGGDSLESAAGLSLIAENDVCDVPLSVTVTRRRQQSSSAVRQGWVQTWFTKTARRDRAVFRLTSAQKQIQIQLPDGAQLEEVAIDGQRVAKTEQGEDRIITIGLAEMQRSYVVELWYTFERSDSPLVPALHTPKIEFPQVVGARSAQRFYWQLAVPRDEHLWHPPLALTPELTWHWCPIVGRLGFWERRAGLQQRDLEKWIGAPEQNEGLPEGVNQYLFSTFGPVSQVEFVSTERRAVLLISSLAVLAIGLLLIFLPFFRHPFWLLIGGLALLVAGFWFPGPAVQVAQAATLGIVVVMIAGLANSVVRRSGQQRAVIRGISRVAREPNTTETQFPRFEGDSQASTAPLAIHLADRDSQ